VERLRGVMVGALAGAVATGPMTGVMVLIHRWLPEERGERLAPEKVVEDVAESVGAEEVVEDVGKERVVWISHYGFGAAMGAIYGAVMTQPRPVAERVASGVVFGLGVWAANYVVAFPAADFKASVEKEPGSRNAQMIVSHVVWGAVVGWLCRGR
jgi:uncharacterized membrane protein YagU involved in acid resistance